MGWLNSSIALPPLHIQSPHQHDELIILCGLPAPGGGDHLQLKKWRDTYKLNLEHRFEVVKAGATLRHLHILGRRVSLSDECKLILSILSNLLRKKDTLAHVWGSIHMFPCSSNTLMTLTYAVPRIDVPEYLPANCH